MILYILVDNPLQQLITWDNLPIRIIVDNGSTTLPSRPFNLLYIHPHLPSLLPTILLQRLHIHISRLFLPFSFHYVLPFVIFLDHDLSFYDGGLRLLVDFVRFLRFYTVAQVVYQD
jgi:hypothetical protein